ncbi:ATP-binding protein [Streptomyces sp. NPDC060006]|uniref:ATP-binding protein n=1 Tax=unclassified Streptomyces TaxID=2593676 RepID=UPI0036CAE018
MPVQRGRSELPRHDVVVLAQLDHVVSELFTNARKYAPGPVLMELRIVDAAVEVAVWDSDPVLPVARAADAGRVGQHGLEIVMAVAQGFEVQRETVGKRITARLALLDDPDGHTSGRRPQL